VISSHSLSFPPLCLLTDYLVDTFCKLFFPLDALAHSDHQRHPHYGQWNIPYFIDFLQPLFLFIRLIDAFMLILAIIVDWIFLLCVCFFTYISCYHSYYLFRLLALLGPTFFSPLPSYISLCRRQICIWYVHRYNCLLWSFLLG